MDTYEATKIVMSRIQSLDPDNASKIMGFILLQDQSDKEMIRLAFGPETLLQSTISQAKSCLGLGLGPTNPPPSSSSSSSSSPRIVVPTNNGFHFASTPSPLSPAASAFQRPFSYAAALGSSSSSSAAHFPFLDEDPLASPGGRSDSVLFSDAAGAQSPNPFHRRSCSVNDAAAFLEEGGGAGGWRPCMYFARGFCKNGGSCKFSHADGFGDEASAAAAMGSPGKNASGFDELLRMKALHQQQRFAAMGAHNAFGYSSKCMDSMNENPRNEFSQMGLINGGGCSNSSARQIYLTFPAESTFKEEDVSNYFSMFGPVQDVRIPYQQKRMFGFVTFVYAETVKLILAKGNPHFVCDSRVLVKPYKEKGKIPDKKQYQQMERGDYSACLSPSADPIDLPFGSRMLFNTQEMVLRRKLEQEAELHHALERRLMNLQLMNLKNQHNSNNHLLTSFRGTGVPISSPRQAAQLLMTENFVHSSHNTNNEDSGDFDGSLEPSNSPPIATDQDFLLEGTESKANNVSDLPDNLEDNLPDNLFASPTKLGGENKSIFSQASASTDDSIPVTIPSSSNNIDSSLKPCYLQIPRLSSEQEAIEM